MHCSPGEKLPTRCVKSRRYIDKAIMLAAAGWPRVCASTRAAFDGKIGIWPFMTFESAKRDRKNRPAKTPVPTCVNVNRQTYRDMLIVKLLLAIEKRWSGATCVVQQDNAPAHVPPSN